MGRRRREEQALNSPYLRIILQIDLEIRIPEIDRAVTSSDCNLRQPVSTGLSLIPSHSPFTQNTQKKPSHSQESVSSTHSGCGNGVEVPNPTCKYPHAHSGVV